VCIDLFTWGCEDDGRLGRVEEEHREEDDAVVG